MADPSHIAAAREFNRFYTAQLGMTRSSVYRTQFSLAEARVLYELGRTASMRVGGAQRRDSRSTPVS